MKPWVEDLKQLFFRFKLYLFGVRFYEVLTKPDSKLIYRTEFNIQDTFYLEIMFYRAECTDYLLKRGTLSTQDYNSYLITSNVRPMSASVGKMPDIPNYIALLNSRSFFFNGFFNKMGLSEKSLLETITDIYLDFVELTFKNYEAQLKKPK